MARTNTKPLMQLISEMDDLRSPLNSRCNSEHGAVALHCICSVEFVVVIVLWLGYGSNFMAASGEFTSSVPFGDR